MKNGNFLTKLGKAYCLEDGKCRPCAATDCVRSSPLLLRGASQVDCWRVLAVTTSAYTS